MNALQVAQYMRRLVDDPGIVGFPASLQATMLELAYEEFRQYAPQEVWEVSYTPATLTGAFQLDLNNILFGAAPTQTRAMRLTRVQRIDPTTGQLLNVMLPATSFETLGQIGGVTAGISNIFGNAKWWLDGRVLRFNLALTGTIQIWYLPVQTVNWLAAIQPGANVFLDDLPQWHDIIALLAAQQYYIKEGQANPKCDQQLARRLAKMEQFYSETRSGQGSRYVQEKDW